MDINKKKRWVCQRTDYMPCVITSPAWSAMVPTLCSFNGRRVDFKLLEDSDEDKG